MVSIKRRRKTSAEDVKLLIRSFGNCMVKNKLRTKVCWIQFGELMVKRGLRFLCLLRG
jgi:hypothetical protein